jgi:hypothetical protein
MQLTARKKEVKKQKDLLPKYYVILVFESIFWKQYYRCKPTGSVEMDLGARFTKQDNLLFPRNRSNLAFDLIKG